MKFTRIPISIHVLRVEDDLMRIFSELSTDISIHVLRVEDDRRVQTYAALQLDFNPRPPCGGRPFCWTLSTVSKRISIHVLRVEDDLDSRTTDSQSLHFNPRPPCGGRLLLTSRPPLAKRFQSTSSVWRTTSWLLA